MAGAFSVDVSELDTLADGLARQLDDVLDPIAGDAVGELADATQDAIRAAARRHRRTGRLDKNIRQVDLRDAGLASSATVAATGMVAPILVGGSRAHRIRPLHARALALRGSGPASGFAAGVRHPGTAPDPFFARGIAASQADVGRIIDRGAERAADQLARVAEGG